MLEDPAFVPILTSASWRGRRQCVCRPLIALDAADMPLVAYGHDAPDRVEYLLAATAREHLLELPAIEAAALRHLRRRAERAPWQVETVETDGGTLSFLAREGDSLTASDILDPELMREAHAHFAARTLMVGIPSRTMMIASDDPLHLIGLIAEMHQTAVDDGGDAVSPLVFCLAQGAITGIATATDSADQDAASD